jgi:hypothetical protein
MVIFLLKKLHGRSHIQAATVDLYHHPRISSGNIGRELAVVAFLLILHRNHGCLRGNLCFMNF